MIDKKNFKSSMNYTIEDNKYIFKKLEFSDIKDDLDGLKNKLKKYTNLYTWLIKVISPVFDNRHLESFLKTHQIKGLLALNIGSGNSHISDSIYNVDIFSYDNVDIVCDIEKLPFKDNTVDIIFNIAVLEHVENPQNVINEIHRVLKPNGIVYTAFPFMQGFHASPYDFTRVTEEGIKILHKDFSLLEVKPFGGPTSGMLWVLQDWIAIFLSFGSKKLHMIIYLFTLALTFPLKYLDFFLIKHPMAKNIASGFIYVGKK